MVATMYVDVSRLTRAGKTYTRSLLRESYREDGKVKHRTIANLSHCSEAEIEAIRLALRHKEDLAEVGSLRENVSLKQGLSVGAVWLVYDIARQLGIMNALGSSRQGKLALWQVIARVIDQGSRLSAVRLASVHAACDILDLEKFNEDDLYDNLDWLNEQQSKIEDRLFQKFSEPEKTGLFLYDVTSSYFEGQQNDLAAFGYNRDKKKGKKQIVIGLLCNAAGIPVSIEVFRGNTQDPQTVASQIRKSAERFGGGDITFVGDRGMIKGQQIEDLGKEGFHYITAITKPQIEALLRKQVFQMELFDQELAEIVTEEGMRYVLRRNPVRAAEIHTTREEKYRAICKQVEGQQAYLNEHPRAQVSVALRKLQELVKKFKFPNWLSVSAEDRELLISVDAAAKQEAAKFDGCYVLKTDLPQEKADKELVHERYKSLTLVQWAFRSSKTAHLEVRPVYVVREKRTRAHVFVVMLAYRIIQELASRWNSLNVTVEEGIDELATLCANEVSFNNTPAVNDIPAPRDSTRTLLQGARVQLPRTLPAKHIRVATKKKLPENRKAA